MDLTSEFDENDLSKCMETSLNDDELCKKFGKSGSELIESQYDWKKISKQIEAIYVTCIHKY